MAVTAVALTAGISHGQADLLGPGSAAQAVTFTFTPPPGAPEVESVTVPGSFNGWDISAQPMEEHPDGSWSVTVELEEGEHQYKFYINDRWPADMCNSMLWGDPEHDGWIDPEADGCTGDGFGGQNAVRHIEAAVAEPVHGFTYHPPPDAPAVESITVPGSFNGWDVSAMPMDRQMDGSWRVEVELDPGRHEYKFYINDAWPQDMCDDATWGDPNRDHWIDPDADGCIDDGHGGQNAYVDIALEVVDEVGLGFRHDPANPAHVSLAAGALSVRFAANVDQVTAATVIVDGDMHPMHRQLSYGATEVWRMTLPEQSESYSFELDTGEGQEAFGPFEVPDELFADVAWVSEAVGYQIFPERYYNADPDNDGYTLKTDSHNFKDPRHWYWDGPPVLMDEWGGEVLDRHCCHQYFGGDLAGVKEKLDHLEQLGVTLIYLTPIFESGSAHGYDAHDYLTVAPNFGDEEVLRRLLDEAEARGMRVMWDFVPNHVGTGHWAFQDAVTNGEESDTWDWFFFHVPHDEVEVGMPDNTHYDSWWGIGNLPVLDTSNPDVFEHLLDVTRYWTEFGFHGIRVDVPGDIRNRGEFFPAFRDAAKSIDPDVYLVGEIWQRNPTWLEGDEFDSLMNYAIGQGVVQRFATGTVGAAAAANDMARLYADYPEASVAMQFNVISSHDTARLLTMMGGGVLGDTPDEESTARQRLASAMLYALPGMPVTFQGDECAFLGDGVGPWEENRYPMQFDDCSEDMVAHYRQLAELRAGLGALATPVLRDYAAQGALLAFYRGEPGSGEVIAVFNSGAQAETLLMPQGEWIDAVSGESVLGSVQVDATSWRYLQRQ